MSNGLRKDFLKGAKDEKSALNHFIGMNVDSALKTKPKASSSHNCTVFLETCKHN